MKKWHLIFLTLIIAFLLVFTASCNFQRGQKDYVDDLIDSKKEADSARADTDQDDQTDDAGKSQDTDTGYTPEISVGLASTYKDELLRDIDAFYGLLYPGSPNADLTKIVINTDAIGDYIYSKNGVSPGFMFDQVDIAYTGGWWFHLELQESWGGQSPTTVFPCTSSDPTPLDWITVCPEGAGPSTSTEWYIYYSVLNAPIVTNDPNYTYTYALVFDADGDPGNNFQFMDPYDWDFWQDTDQWYILDWFHNNQTWNLTVSGENWSTVETDGRAVIYGNSVFWMIPAEDFLGPDPGFRLSSFVMVDSFEAESSGGDVNGGNPTEPLSILDTDPIYIADPPFTTAADVSIVLDGWKTCPAGGCQYNEATKEQQKTFVSCTDPAGGCAKVGPPTSHCALYSRAKGDPPQDPDSWTYVVSSPKKIQKDWTLEYHCFCVK